MHRCLLLCLLLAAPLPATPQKPPIVAMLSTDSNDELLADKAAAFRRGLAEAGLVEGRDLALQVMWADGNYERLPQMARDLARGNPAVAFAASLPSALALKKHAPQIPMVFVMGADPVRQGLVASLQQPGGNATGVSQLYGALGGKRLELLRDLVPSVKVVGVLTNPRNANAKAHLEEVRKSARKMPLEIEVLSASTAAEIDAAFRAATEHKISAFLIADDPFFNVERRRIVALAATHKLPAVHYSRDFVALGGLASYGSDVRDNYRLAGSYAAKLLRGAKPADLPVLQPTRFELVVNAKTARLLGIAVRPELRLRADEIIE